MKHLFFLLVFSASVTFAKNSDYLPKTLFVELGKKINPAVVNISSSQKISPVRPRGGQNLPPGSDEEFRRFFEEFMGPMGPYNMPEQSATSLGSGFIFDADGFIITNNHVIKGATDIQVQLTEKSKTKYKAKVIGFDSKTDIAVIKINVGSKLPVAPLGDSDKLEVGEWVAAFGNPFGYGHSMTKGIVSAKEREQIDLPEGGFYPFIQTDASINPGNSGGPLVNSDGEVIGVNTAIDARAQGIGFAIPINVVKKLIPDLKTKGRVPRGYLGVQIGNIDEKIQKQFGLKSTKGAFVVAVPRNSPAGKAGIQPYDVISDVDGQEIEDSRMLTRVVGLSTVGKTIRVGLMRDGKPLSVTVKIAERQEEQVAQQSGEETEEESEAPGQPAPFKIGLSLTNLTPRLAKEYNVPEDIKSGVLVTGVKKDGLAAQAGLRPGDVILDINRKPIKSSGEAQKAFQKGNNVMRVLRAENTILVFMEVK